MTLANLMFIAFIVGFILVFICCLFLLYLIRREMEQVAEGERVAIKNCEINGGKKCETFAASVHTITSYTATSATM